MDPTDIEIAALASSHRAPLGADNVPDKNQSHHCFSCEAPIRGLYCDACGQKNDNFRRSIFSLIRELFGSLTGIESRIWRTWAALLFKPGKVAREFADGKRTTWTSPVRAFLAMSILLFGYISFTGTQLVSIDLHPVLKDSVDKPVSELTDDDYRLTGGVHFFERRSELKARNADQDFELLERKLVGSNGTGISLDIGTDSVEVDPRELEETVDPKKIAESKETVQDLTVFGQSIDTDAGIRNFVDIIKDPQEVNAVVYYWLPKIMILMMPFSMFIGAIFIRGRGNALLYDHLVHAAYIHAVTYFLIFIGIILARLMPAPPLIFVIIIGMLIYLPLSLKRMFKRGWFKTIWTTYGVGFVYFLTIFIVMLVLIILGVAQSLGAIG